MKNADITKLLPVRFPREACRTCPNCATWMASHGSRKTGRPGCPLCHGDGRVPYMYLPPERVSGRQLTVIEQGNTPVLMPLFGECKEPGKHRAMKMGSQVRCPGCDDLCVMPDNIQAGDLITTDLSKKRRSHEFYSLKTAL
ncbi:hypothetical protein SAMN05660337_1206 [Maridesulfovibrio ferrireducens]|uniref:Uncharacterized protein n=1 Tax=Maridesulfovibrio ferrireducens TaxID=246191 RepID=A0A1G9EPK5_9BACT|nr:hypothetical protein [Maridesulfovibrio ferrireducens]SDK77993.1 hypothetical protein SAMN05660337_1206 [Maridesulfovibrio ferrireducens]